MQEWKNKENSGVRVFVRKIERAKILLYAKGIGSECISEFNEIFK